jgi:hypothetical protein
MNRHLIRSALPLLLALAACNDPAGPGPGSIRFADRAPVVGAGDTVTLALTTADGKSAAAHDVTWASLDKGIATVSAAGLVQGVARGTARIVINASGALDTAKVRVIPVRFNVQANDACGKTDYRTGRVVATGTYSVVIADNNNPSGGLTTAEYRKFAEDFDKQVYPTITRYFGEPKDIDDNGRVLIFFTRAVNELTPAGSKGYVGGFFFARDLFPVKGTAQMQACAGSNEAEMFYMLAADPTGVVNGNKVSKETVTQVGVGIIAHEFQHLINASRRLFVNNADDWEETWLNEGLSHIAEELMFYQASGLSRRQNLDVNRIRASQSTVDAFNNFALSNFGRLSHYYEAPELNSPYGDSASLGERGAVWQYLRHLADRSSLDEAEFWKRLANSKTAGFANLKQVIGEDPLPLLRDWGVAAYTDDFVTTADATRFQLPSWNHRSLLQAVNLPGPKAQPLSDRSRKGVTLVGGGSAYLAFSVPLGQGEIRLTPGSTPAVSQGCPAGSALKLAVGQVHTTAAGDVDGLCVESGEYLLVPTHMSDVAASKLSFSVTGFGITPPITTSTFSPVAGLGRVEIPRLLARLDQPLRDLALEARVRRVELEELAPRLGAVGRRFRPDRALQPQAAAQGAVVPGLEKLYLSVVRTR